MTLEMAESENGVEFSKFRHSGTLGGALMVSGSGPFAPVPGELSKTQVRAAPVRRGIWELAPSLGVEVSITPSRQQRTPRSGTGGSGLRGR